MRPNRHNAIACYFFQLAKFFEHICRDSCDAIQIDCCYSRLQLWQILQICLGQFGASTFFVDCDGQRLAAVTYCCNRSWLFGFFRFGLGFRLRFRLGVGGGRAAGAGRTGRTVVVIFIIVTAAVAGAGGRRTRTNPRTTTRPAVVQATRASRSPTGRRLRKWPQGRGIEYVLLS